MSSKSSSSDTRGREAKLEQIRRQNAADKRRQRIIALVTAGIIVVLAGVVGVVIWQAAREEATLAGADPGNRTPQTFLPEGPDGEEGPVVNGFAAGPADAAATVTLFEDYICPACGQFEQILGTYIDGLPAQGVQVIYHPVAILDPQSQGTRYSSRAASAVACVADQDDDELTQTKAFSGLLFLNQPAEGSAGLENEVLAQFAADAGAPEAVQTCITDETYLGWAERATEDAQNAGLSATPTIWVNGTPVPQEQVSEQGIQALIEAAGGGTGTEPSADASVEPSLAEPDTAEPSAPASN